MSVAYGPTIRLYGLSPLWSASLPLVTLIYLGATLDSALRHWLGKGVAWKGRLQVRTD